MKRIVVWLIGLSALTACITSDDPTLPDPSPNSPPAPTLSAGPPAIPDGRCPELTGGAQSHVFLKDVRVAGKDGFDRVVFEFEPASGSPSVIPKYSLTPTAPPFTEDPSYKEITVAGEDFYQIIFHGATGVDLTGEDFRQTYTGPKSIKPEPELAILVEARQQGDFETTLAWIFGLSRRSCAKVTTLKAPLRFVIDLPH